jgi:hypothetical protein
MGMIKIATLHIPIQRPILSKLPAFEDHPSWLTGLQAMEAFHQWVATIVLPIAFAWIYEHYDEVYGSIEKLPDGDKYKDDVGVVIAAAFQLVKETKKYKEGVEAYEKLQEGLKSGSLDTSKLNPIWTKITNEVRTATEGIFKAEKKYLDDTV